MPDSGGQGEDALQDADQDSGQGAPAVGFEVKLSLEGAEDRLDDLAEWFEELGSGSFGLAFAGRAEQAQAIVSQGGLKAGAEVVLVADEDLAGQQRGQAGVGGQDVQQDLPLVGFGAGEREPDGQAVQGGQDMQPQHIAESGTLKECTYTADGEETIIELYRQGAVFGEPALFAPERTRVVTIVAVSEASVIAIGREPLMRFLLAHPPAMLRMLEGLAAQTRELVEGVTELGHARIRDRLALKLAELAETHGSDHPAGRRVDVELSQSALGALIAASRTNTNRALADLIQEGAISVDGRRYVVTSPAGLRASVGADARLLHRNNQRPRHTPPAR